MKIVCLIVITILVPTTIFAKKDKAKSNYITYLSSWRAAEKYCNGRRMRPEAYKRTIRIVKTTNIPSQGLSKQQLLNKTIAAASGKNNLVINSFQKNNKTLITFKDGTAYIAPIDGWAGIYLFMCSWKPLVDANLERFHFVKKIVWQQV